MHPDADTQEDERGEQRGQTLGDFPAGPADRYDVGRHDPGYCSGRQSKRPADVHVAYNIVSMGLAKERDHGHDDQQCFQAFAHENREGTEKGGRRRCLARRELLIRRGQQPVQLNRLRCNGLGGMVEDRGTILRHVCFQLNAQVVVTCGQSGLDRLDAV